jgi:tetratricopeptide (TPR) repeat protein
MLFRRFGILMVLLSVYSTAFFFIDRRFQDRDLTLDVALPDKFQRIASGYLKQVVSEILFIKTSVFLGGVKPGTHPETYAGPLSNNFQVMTSLYPQFVDPYFFSQSFLAPISPADANAANSILKTGIEHLPENHILRFFHGFNYYQYLNEPLKAAAVFKEAAKLTDAPPMFGHLAAVFSAHGGNIRAGLTMLHAMLTVEQDEGAKKKYQKEIEIFEKALLVEEAVHAYEKNHSVAPKNLQDLVPGYIDEIPDKLDGFELTYNPPNLKLIRPKH